MRIGGRVFLDANDIKNMKVPYLAEEEEEKEDLLRGGGGGFVATGLASAAAR